MHNSVILKDLKNLHSSRMGTRQCSSVVLRGLVFIRDCGQNGIQQDYSGTGPREHIGFELGHILCNNSFVFFSS